MKGQGTLGMVMVCMDITSVFCTICPVFIWFQNYFNVNAYIYYFGMTPGRYFYITAMLVWVFWNWRNWVYFSTLNCLYLISTIMWIHDIL